MLDRNTTPGINMETSPKNYQIRVRGKVPDRWQTMFDPFTLTDLPEGDTLLCGEVIDQSQLIGVLNQIHSLNLKIISVNAAAN